MRSAVLRHRDTDAATRVTANRIDPDRAAMCGLLLVLMLLSLLMSAALPEAFAGRARTFAVMYVTIQLPGGVFMVAASHAGVMRSSNAHIPRVVSPG